MNPKVSEGILVLRQWDRTGLTETQKTFSSLEELYTYCLATVASDPDVVDRIVIQGHDEHGQPRVLSFSFASITATTR